LNSILQATLNTQNIIDTNAMHQRNFEKEAMWTKE